MLALNSNTSTHQLNADRILGYRVLVRLQDPIQLDDYSESEPDIALVRPDPNFYADRHPTAETYI